jgi:hypothetical protein
MRFLSAHHPLPQHFINGTASPARTRACIIVSRESGRGFGKTGRGISCRDDGDVSHECFSFLLRLQDYLTFKLYYFFSFLQVGFYPPFLHQPGISLSM